MQLGIIYINRRALHINSPHCFSSIFDLLYMKNSIYNSLINLSEQRSLLYNALTDNFLVLIPWQRDVWMNGLLDKIEKKHPRFYHQLEENGYVVADDRDEYSELICRIEEMDNNPQIFILTINPTLECNFRCWYCYEEHHPTKMSNEMLVRTKRFIERTVTEMSDLTHFSLSFFGGEPLLSFRSAVVPLIEHAKAICQQQGVKLSISFTSNAALLTPRIIKYFSTCKNLHLQITLDGDRTSHNQVRYFKGGKGSYDLILKNIRLLLEQSVSITLRINFTTDNLGSVMGISDDLNTIDSKYRHLLIIDFQQVWQDKNNMTNINDLLEDTQARFREIGFVVTYRNIVRQFNSCYADKTNEAVINYNGDVYHCTARDFTTERREGVLTEEGTIEWDASKQKLRKQLKLQNPACHQCRIAPLCFGGCSQQSIEHTGKEYCLYQYNDDKKDDLILTRFTNCFLNKFK